MLSRTWRLTLRNGLLGNTIWSQGTSAVISKTWTRLFYFSFFQHRRHSTKSCTIEPKLRRAEKNTSNNGLLVEFENGITREFFHVWLRDSCRCPLCFDSNLELRNMDSWVPELNIQPKSYEVTSEGHLAVRWPSGQDNSTTHESEYSSPWLWQCHLKIKEGTREVCHDDFSRPSIRHWSRLTQLPTLSYSDYINTQDGLMRWMNLFHEYGFVILKNVPEDKTEQVPLKFSFIRETCFGRTSEVLVGPESGNHPGYTGVSIDLHTDLTYMERSPGTLNLHCLRSADPDTFGKDAGGETMLSDGMEAANWMKNTYPEMFQLLTQIRLPYAYRMPSTGYMYRSSWPVLSLDSRGNVTEIHFSNFARRVLNLQEKLILPLFQALKTYANRLQETKTSFFLRPGDLLSINNRRVLHARTHFDPRKATRHLRTYYMDLDEVYGCYDVLLNKERETK